MKNIIIRIIILTFFPLLGVQALAQSKGADKSGLFLIDFNSIVGWGNSQISTDANVPSIGTFGLGIGLGINIKKVSIGLSYDYRVLTQFSDVNAAVGNRRGTFVSPASLLFRINFEKLNFEFLLISNGTYDLTNITAAGKKVVYTDPSGIRFSIMFKKLARFNPVIFFESVNFSGQLLDGVKATLGNPLSYSNFGAGLKYEF